MKTIRQLDREIRQLENNPVPPKKINHILHLLLTILTGGLWLIVWILTGITDNTAPARKKHQKKLDELYAELDKLAFIVIEKRKNK